MIEEYLQTKTIPVNEYNELKSLAVAAKQARQKRLDYLANPTRERRLELVALESKLDNKLAEVFGA